MQRPLRTRCRNQASQRRQQLLRDLKVNVGFVDKSETRANAVHPRYALTREDSTTIEPNDPQWDKLEAMSKAARTHALAWVSQSDLCGDLIDDAAFREQFQMWLSLIWSRGAEVALSRYLDG